MKKWLLILLVLVSLAGVVWVFAYQYTLWEQESIIDTQQMMSWTTSKNVSDESINPIVDSELSKDEIVRKKIESIKNRLALKWLIMQWDSYYRNQQLPLALKKYLEFYRQNPEDDLIIQKLWDTYFELKKFGSALNYYKLLSQLGEENRKQLALSYLASEDISNPVVIQNLNTLLEEKNYPEQERYYFNQSLSCITDFHNCKIQFQTYFEQADENWEVREISYAPLWDLKLALENYKNFQVDEVYLKNAYMISSWYSNRLYKLASKLGDELLLEKKDYKPILKIVAQSQYELGEYSTARTKLWDYYIIDALDPAVSYILGVVNEKLKDYVLANIYFQKSIELWYTPSIDPRRHIIHNFYLLQNDKSLLLAFEKMVSEEESLQKDDLTLAIYYHIIFDSFELALEWSKKWQELFPEDWDFYAYQWWILREQWRLKDALSALQLWGKVEEKNPFVFINIAYTVKELWNIPGAKIYFQKVIDIAPDSDYANQATAELTALEK